MKAATVVLVLLVLAVLLPACYTLDAVNVTAGRGGDTSGAGTTAASDRFVVSRWHNHFVFGLVTPDSVDVSRIVSAEVNARGGTRASNVKVKYEMTFVNGLLNIITAGIYNPFTLTVTGDVLK